MEEQSGDNKGVSIFAKKEKTKILQNGTKYIVMTFSDSVISLLLAGLMLLGVSFFFVLEYHDITETLLMLGLSTNQSIELCNPGIFKVIALFC
jgi:hypothetical protein